jgi:hypothetical protein
MRLRAAPAAFVALLAAAPAAGGEAASADTSPPAAPAPWASLGVAASYGGSVRSGVIWDGPGLVLAADEPSWPEDPELSLELRYVFPHAWDGPNNVIETISGRAGISVRWWGPLRLGLGAGLDREAGRATQVGPNMMGGAASLTSTSLEWRPAARAFVRVASRSWRGFSVGATLFLDTVSTSDPQDRFRGGFSVEAWWRS